jgi:hypothetical protein
MIDGDGNSILEDLGLMHPKHTPDKLLNAR